MLQSIKPKEVDGFEMVCEECGEEFGVTYFEYTVDQPMCKICNDGDEPCPECGIAPSQDIRVKHICKNCQMKKAIVVSGKAT